MKDLHIVGAGGFGREIYFLAQECVGYGSDFLISGYIDDDVTRLKSYPEYPQILGTLSDLSAGPPKSVFVAVGNNKIRSGLVKYLSERGHDCITLVHRSARVSGRLRCGRGSFIGPLVSIGADVTIGSGVFVQTGVIVGHDVNIGSFCRLDNYAVLVAGAIVKDRACVHSGAIVNGGVVVGEDATVGAASFVIRRVRDGTTVVGNPAREL
jgi:sugar O-acyltransferase (sialic acid O-acetyltransferase NeuD family)